MNEQTVKLLLQLISLASALAPEILRQVEGIRAQSGLSADEIFANAGVTIDQNEAKALQILAGLMPEPPPVSLDV